MNSSPLSARRSDISAQISRSFPISSVPLLPFFSSFMLPVSPNSVIMGLMRLMIPFAIINPESRAMMSTAARQGMSRRFSRRNTMKPLLLE